MLAGVEAVAKAEANTRAGAEPWAGAEAANTRAGAEPWAVVACSMVQGQQAVVESHKRLLEV